MKTKPAQTVLTLSLVLDPEASARLAKFCEEFSGCSPAGFAAQVLAQTLGDAETDETFRYDLSGWVREESAKQAAAAPQGAKERFTVDLPADSAAELRRVSELALLAPETILAQESAESIATCGDEKTGYLIESMQVWLDRKVYPEAVRPRVRARIREHYKKCTPKVRAFLRSISASGKVAA